jgi:hypothetical protein
MKNKFKSAAAGLGLLVAGCSASPSPPEGFSPVDDSYVASLPKEPITAVIGHGYDHVSVLVDSPASCVQTSRTLVKTAEAAGTDYDNFADCIAKDGDARLVIIKGTVYAPGKLVAPSAPAP